MVEVAKFNVGGHHYKVARTLLEQHPDTMLARRASQMWQQDPESEIFLERNGIRFRYVLDYLRDGKVFLPMPESKEALIQDLNYFGIEAIDNRIHDSKLHTSSFATKNVPTELELDKAYKRFAVKCLYKFCSSSLTLSGTSFLIDRNTDHANLLQSATGADMCNLHLKRFGLQMKLHEFESNSEGACIFRINVQELCS